MGQKSSRIILKGVSASAGKAEGRAIVIRSASEQGKMADGRILVVHFTTPLLIPAILKSSAIVTDKGGVMCHAAVIAREFGIPSVTGTEEATQKIKDNMEIIVDGTTAIESAQNPLPPEGPGVIAEWDGDKLTEWGSFSSPGIAHLSARGAMKLPPDGLRLIAACVGGSYGSKHVVGTNHIMLYAAALLHP